MTMAVTCGDCGREFKGDKAQSACNKHFNVSPIQQHIDYLIDYNVVLIFNFDLRSFMPRQQTCSSALSVNAIHSSMNLQNVLQGLDY